MFGLRMLRRKEAVRMILVGYKRITCSSRVGRKRKRRCDSVGEVR